MQFYVLDTRPTGKNEFARTDLLQEDNFRTGEAPRCAACGQFVGMRDWLPPYRVELETWGKEYGDFAFFGTPDYFLVSEKFKTIWEGSTMTGLSDFAPVEVIRVKRYTKPKGIVPTYFKANVCRSNTAVDLAASGYEWAGEPALCPACLRPINSVPLQRWKKTIIKEETWQGEDIFIAHGASDFITNNRFKEVCEANSIRNAIFIRAEEHGHDFYPSHSTLLLRYLRILEDTYQHRESRQDAFRTLAFMIDPDLQKAKYPFGRKFDPDTEIEPTIVQRVKERLTAEGLYQTPNH